MKAKKVTPNFRYIGRDSALKMTVFSDASFGNLSDGGTQREHLIVGKVENFHHSRGSQKE